MQELKIKPSYDYSKEKSFINATDEDVNLIVDISNCTDANQINLFLVAINGLLMSRKTNILINGTRVLKNYKWPSQVLAESFKVEEKEYYSNPQKREIVLNVLPFCNDPKAAYKKPYDCFVEENGRIYAAHWEFYKKEKTPDEINYRKYFGYYHNLNEYEYKLVADEEIHISKAGNLYKTKYILAEIAKVFSRLNSTFSPTQLVGQKCRLFESLTGYITFAKRSDEIPKNSYEYNTHYEVERKVNLTKLTLNQLDLLSDSLKKDIMQIYNSTWKGGCYNIHYGGLCLLDADNKPIVDVYDPLLGPRNSYFFIRNKKILIEKPKKNKKLEAEKLKDSEKEELLLLNKIFSVSNDIIKLITKENLTNSKQSGLVRLKNNINYIKNIIASQNYDVIPSSEESLEDIIQDIINISSNRGIKKSNYYFWYRIYRKVVKKYREVSLLDPMYENTGVEIE